MSLSPEDIKASYPLPAYNYKVTLDDETVAFSEVSGLTKSYEKVVYKHGFSYLMGPGIVRGQQNEILITLKRGVVARRDQLYQWFTGSEWLTGTHVKDIYIDLCNEKGEAIVRWKISKALPLKLEAPLFNADDNRVAIETMEVSAQDILMEYL